MDTMIGVRKNRERKLVRVLTPHKKFLIERLRQEWDEASRAARREEMVRRVAVSARVVAKTLLVLCAIGGILTVAAVAPNIFGVIGKSGRRSFFKKEALKNAVHYLQRKGQVATSQNKSGYHIAITSKGEIAAIQYAYKNFQIKKPKQWDGVWRVIIFDIPDRRKWSRDTLRRQLRNLGFYQLQKSVFVSPYPCEEEIRFLAGLLGVDSDTRLIRTREIIYDQDLKEFFKLE